MSATLKQAKKMLELIDQSGRSSEQLQELFPYLSVLLCMDIDEISLVDFRKACGLKPVREKKKKAITPMGISVTIVRYTVLVDYDRSMEDGIKAGKYDRENNAIAPGNFPSQETGIIERLIGLFHCAKDMSTAEAIAEMDKKGYRPITLKELLALGEKHPGLQREFPVVALGSVARYSQGYYPCLINFLADRALLLCFGDDRWGARCRFAAIRK